MLASLALLALGGLSWWACTARMAGDPDASLGYLEPGSRPNLLVLTADDMDYGSLGVTGAGVPGLSPNLDRLASEGILFTQAHVTVASCEPSRQSLLTGRYPHRYGPSYWGKVDASVPTLTEELSRAGYLCGVLGKVDHHRPVEKFGWDFSASKLELGLGRDPEAFGTQAAEFFRRAQREGRPFFLLANSSDPHRPLAGSDWERNKWARETDQWRREHPEEDGPGPYVPPPIPRTFDPRTIPVPGFLPDLPGVRADLARYFASVHRLDQCVGAILAALDELGLASTTQVTFLSDHGMGFPFSKGNVYRHSTRTPWIVRWPGHIEPGRRNEDLLVSGVDLMPSLLSSVGAQLPGGMDGRSYLAAAGVRDAASAPGDARRYVLTFHDDTASGDLLPMRAIQDLRFGYVLNLWADGNRTYSNAATNGESFQAIKAAADEDPEIQARLTFFRRRTREELYDYSQDPYALDNLASDPAYSETLERMHDELLTELAAIADPRLEEARAVR